MTSEQDAFDLVIVTGMSGAGRTEALRVFEDLGYFCVDNLPPALIGGLIELCKNKPDTPCRKLAVVCDARMGNFFEHMHDELEHLATQHISIRILFLDAADEKLIARYKSSRRRHPLCDDGASISRGIARERDVLYDIRQRAHVIIDTTHMLPAELRTKLNEAFAHGATTRGLAVTVYSFGFKHGVPRDADLVVDVRFLPNPYYEARLKYLTGLDQEVRDYVLYNEETEKFLKRWEALLGGGRPGYVNEGKRQLAIGIGCTGGQHRSVCLAEVTGEYLASLGYRVSVAHRDLSLAQKREPSARSATSKE